MMARKIMLLGEIGVGKSSLVRRLVHDRFETDYQATIGVEISRFEIRGGGPDGCLDVDLIIWDTDGTFGDSILRHTYIKGASGALIVGDATRRTTLEAMRRIAAGFATALPGRDCVLVLNKMDLLAGQPEPALPEPLVDGGHILIRTSAKTGHHVRDAFIELAVGIVRRGL